MTVIASPPPAPTAFHQGIPYGDFAGPSNSHDGQLSTRSSRHLSNGSSAMRTLANLEGASSRAFGTPRPTNGHSTGSHPVVAPTQHVPRESHQLTQSHSENQKLVHRPRAQISRTQTDFGPSHQVRTEPGAGEDNGELRHGWEDQYNSSEFLGLLSSVSASAPYSNASPFICE